MLLRHSPLAPKLALALLALASLALPAQAQMGYLLSGAGPINKAMGGASVGAPIDGPGALYWNPAGISALPNSIDFGVELLWPQTRLASSITGLGAGSDRGDNGIFPLPTMALVYRPDDSPLTWGLGVFAIGGFGTSYPASVTNPILTPQPPFGVGLGSIYSNLQLIQLVPTVSLQVSDKLSIGVGPTLTLGNLRGDPLFVTAPLANGQFPAGAHSRVAWGGGFNVGALYQVNSDWSLGASFKSPQWMEDYHFQSQDNLGRPILRTFHLDVPYIASIGLGYTGIERLTLATDFRYIDYHNTNGTKESGFAPNGAVRGLGWRNIFCAAFGAQYQLTNSLAVRGGYAYNDNPIASEQSTFNVASPLVIQHTASVGLSYRVSDALTLSMAYLHLFQNSVEGPLVTPAGIVPGSSIRSTSSADSLLIGATVLFGARTVR